MFAIFKQYLFRVQVVGPIVTMDNRTSHAKEKINVKLARAVNIVER